MAMTGDSAPVRVRIDPDMVGAVVRDALAGQVATIVAATMRFLLLNPETWLYHRLTVDDRAQVEQVITQLADMPLSDFGTGRCPLCQHDDPCADDCPVSVVRTIARRL